MRLRLLLATSVALLMVAGSVRGDVVFQDSFDNDGVTNNGIGGELLTGARNGGTLFTDTGSLTASTNFGSHQSWAWTANQFDLTQGFSLDVDFTTVAAGNPSFTFSFGIIDEVTAGTGLGGLTGNLVALGATDVDGNLVAFQPTDRNGNQGLNTDFGTLESASTALNSTVALGTTQVFNLTVAADGSGSATLDGTSTSFGTGTFSDLFANSTDGEFHFAVFSQGNNDPGSSLNSVTLTAVPEPTSLAVLGTFALGLVIRRRRN